MYKIFTIICLLILVLLSISFSRTIVITDTTKTFRIISEDTVSSAFDTSYFMHKSVYSTIEKCCEKHIKSDVLTKAILDLQKATFANYDSYIQLLSTSYDTLKLAFDTLSTKTQKFNNTYIDSIKNIQRKLIAASDSINAAKQNVQQLKDELKALAKKSNRFGIAGLVVGCVSAATSMGLAIYLIREN